MRFVRQKNQHLRYAGRFLVSPQYLFLFTGKRVIVLDRSGEYVAEIETPSGTYNGILSQDGTRLLITSITKQFAVVDLKDMTVRQHTIKGYDQIVACGGAWGESGDYFYIPVQRQPPKRFHIQTLRRYNVEDFNDYTDFLTGHSSFFYIAYEPNIKKLFLIVRSGWYQYSFVWYDGKDFEVFPLPDNINDDFQEITMHTEEQIISWYSFNGIVESFGYDGKPINNLSKKVSKANIDVLKKFLDKLPMGKDNEKMKIECTCISADGKYLYVGAWFEFLVLDIESGEVLARRSIGFDAVDNIVELSEKLVLLSSRFSTSGVKMFRLE